MRRIHPAIVAAALGAALLMVTRKGGGVANPAKVQAFAEAIAFAEGFYAPGNPVPRRNNNPGDLKASNVPSVGKDAQGHLIFASLDDGWRALREQLEKIAAGTSLYTLDMTLVQMATRYAEWSTNWSTNVAARLGVSPLTSLRALLT